MPKPKSKNFGREIDLTVCSLKANLQLLFIYAKIILPLTVLHLLLKML